MFDLVPTDGAPEGVRSFDFDGHSIRVVMLPAGVTPDGAHRAEDQPWFVAADVCRALSLRGYPSAHTSRLDLNERKVLKKNRVSSHSLETLFDPLAPTVTLISESGLYKLILRANSSPTATRFQNWVTKEVLPNIRKHGGYTAGQEHLPASVQAAHNAAHTADAVSFAAPVSRLDALEHR
jgi:prophage antirepressor-like protein